MPIPDVDAPDIWYRWNRYLISMIPMYDGDGTNTYTRYRPYHCHHRYMISAIPMPIPIAQVNANEMWSRWNRYLISMIQIYDGDGTTTDTRYRTYRCRHRYMISTIPMPVPMRYRWETDQIPIRYRWCTDRAKREAKFSDFKTNNSTSAATIIYYLSSR